MELIFTLEEIDRTAIKFLEEAGGANIIAFHGGLGAGKTTFIKALCKAKEVKDVISSPTFSLINDYVFIGKSDKEEHIFHLDLYRIRDEEEAVQAGIEDCLYSGSLCFVEWPGKISGLLPENTLHVTLSPAGKGRKLAWE